MRLGTIAFLIGVTGVQQLSGLPPVPLVTLGAAAAALAFTLPRLRLLGAGLAGAAWAAAWAHAAVAATHGWAPPDGDLVLEGRIAGIPEERAGAVRFPLDVDRVTDHGPPPGRVRITWYGNPPRLVPGERWRLTTRLRLPRGLANPGAFDYERWLFRRGFAATGYVRADAPYRRMDAPAGYGLERVRQKLARAIGDAVEGGSAAVVRALAVGRRDGLTDEQWEVLIRTGTNHLMAISGLHVGLVAGVAFVAGRWAWSRAAVLSRRLAAPLAGAGLGLMAATGYAALAGFAIPTQRALVMVAVFLGGIIARRNIAPSRSLALALLAVLVFDPWVVLDAGFWLSFAAVACILLGATGRLDAGSRWHQWGRVQWVAALGLAPLTGALLHRISIIAPVANLVAVPWVGLVVVPAALLGTALIWLLPGVGALFLQGAALGVQALWMWLEPLADLGIAEIRRAPPAPWTVAAAALGAALLLGPRGLPGRWLGPLLWLPFFLAPGPVPPEGGTRLTVLDVADGQAVIVRTRRHTVLFGTGPRLSGTLDGADAAVVPYLRHAGVRRLDMAVIPDHPASAGGAATLRGLIPVQRWIGTGGTACDRSARWTWDGIAFRALAAAGVCALHVSGPGGSALIVGPATGEGVRSWIAAYGPSAGADVLVLPTAATDAAAREALRRATKPQKVLAAGTAFTGAFRASADHGALRITSRPHAAWGPVRAWRDTGRRYWHRNAR